MGKNKSKGGNSSGKVANPALTSRLNKLEKPIVVVKPANEILTTEEGERLLNDSVEKMEEYCKERRDAADKYYDEKIQEANSFADEKQKQIDNEVKLAVQEKERDMNQRIENAKKEAETILEDAKRKAENIQSDLDCRCEEHTKKIASLESSKLTYKKEVLDSVESQMMELTSENGKLEKKIADLEKDIRTKDKKIEDLEEESQYYEDAFSKNALKRTEILEYKTRIDALKANYETLEALYNEQKEELSTKTSQILLYGDDPQKALKDNEELAKKIKSLQEELLNCPTAEELAKLRETSQRFEETTNKLEFTIKENARLEEENRVYKLSKDDIESYRRFIKILELQKAELQRELERNIELYNSSTEKVFASLSLIDKKECDEYPSMHSRISLRQLCEKFRGYLATRNTTPLYYEERTIRTFIAGFASSRLMILEGLSGTGKSSLPRAFQDFLGAKTIEVPVQSSWKDRNDLLGFYNDFKKQYKETEFLKALYQATHDKNNIYVIVLDEMNLSRIEYYFADLLSVLEKPNVEDWKIELIADYASISQNQDAWPELIHEGKLQIGDNTWFVGTANKDDSTFIITDKVYDRSVVLSFDQKGKKGQVESSTPIKLNNDDFQNLLKAASTFKDHNVKENFDKMIADLDYQVKEMFQITFGNRISNQLEKFVPVYIECGGTLDEAVDIMFSKKILRKLEGIYDEDTKTNLDMLKEEIERKYKMPITIATIERMVEKI